MFSEIPLIKAISMAIGVVILGKLITVLFSNYLENKFHGSYTKKNDVDFDYLVEKKKKELSKGKSNTSDPTQLTSEQIQKNKRSKTEQYYSKQLNKHDSSSEEFQSTKEALKIFDSLQWGEGPTFVEIRNQIEKVCALNFEVFEITKSFKSIIRLDLLILIKRPELPNAKEIQQICTNVFFITKIFEIIKNDQIHQLDTFFKRYNIDKDIFVDAYYLYINTTLDPVNLFAKQLSSTDELKSLSIQDIESKLINYIYADDKKSVISFKSFIDNLTNLVQEIEIFYPIMDVDNSTKNATSILKLPENFDQDMLKSKYKKMAKIRHPDRFISKNLPDNIMKNISDNFTKIKDAYDLLRK